MNKEKLDLITVNEDTGVRRFSRPLRIRVLSSLLSTRMTLRSSTYVYCNLCGVNREGTHLFISKDRNTAVAKARWISVEFSELYRISDSVRKQLVSVGVELKISDRKIRFDCEGGAK